MKAGNGVHLSINCLVSHYTSYLSLLLFTVAVIPVTHRNQSASPRLEITAQKSFGNKLICAATRCALNVDGVCAGK